MNWWHVLLIISHGQRRGLADESQKCREPSKKWVDHSISVTVNLPNNVDEELVNQLYVEAWRSGCKGCTIYRDGSRSGVMISVKNEKEQPELP